MNGSTSVVAGHRIVFERAPKDVHGQRAKRRIVAMHDLRLAAIYGLSIPDPK